MLRRPDRLPLAAAPETAGRWARRLRWGAAAIVAGSLATAGTLAQDAATETVERRKRPDFEPLGLDLDRLLYGPQRPGPSTRASGGALGSFVIYPKLELETFWEDNIFRTQNNRQDDFIFRIKPSIAIVSDWERHAVGLSAAAKFDRYAEHRSENNEEYQTEANGRLDITEDLTLSGKAGFAHLVETRGSINDPGPLLDPTRYNAYTAQTSLEYTGPIFIRPTFDFRRLVYEDNNGIDYSDRDINQYGVRLRVGTALNAETMLFVEPGYNWRRHDRAVDNKGFRRDSEGYQILGGLAWNVSDVTKVEVAMGYLSQEYEDKRLGRVSGIAAQGEIIWNATDNITVTALLRRSVEETNVADVSGVLVTVGEAGFQYEFADNLYGLARVAFGNYDYGSADRDDSVWQFGIGLTYFLTRNFYGGIGYEYTVRDSNQAGLDFRNNRVMIRLGAQL
ncbi:MAG: outer membrane beta-barrel protein [Alphaproteobacteria bacterium]